MHVNSVLYGHTTLKAVIGLLIVLSIGFALFRFVNPMNTNNFIVVNRDGTHYSSLRLEFAGEGRGQSWERPIRIGWQPGSARVVTISNALRTGILSLTDDSGNRICEFEFRPHGRYYQTIVIELQKEHFKINEHGILHVDGFDQPN